MKEYIDKSPATDEREQLRQQILDLVGRYAEVAHAPKAFVAGHSAVPVSGKVYGVSDMQALVDSALDFWLTAGRFNNMFEERLARFLGVHFAITCNSGSSANLLAATALTSHLLGDCALKTGDEVITCATGFPTTVNPLLQNGFVPVFIDVDIPTYNIRPDLIEAAVTSKTRAIMVAHTLGNPFDLDTVMSVAKKHNLFVVEDSCDALGATYNGKKVSTFGDIATVSFYPAHHITTGEGGAVFTNSVTLKRIVESLRTGGVIAGATPVAIMRVENALNGGWVSYPMATITNTPIRISAIISRSPICKRRSVARSLTGLMSSSRAAA